MVRSSCSRIFSIVAAGFIIASCGDHDDHNCGKGYVWDAVLKACRCDIGGGYYIRVEGNELICGSCIEDSSSIPECNPSTDAGSDTENETDTGLETGTDTDVDAGNDTDWEIETDSRDNSGIGNTCASNDECAGFDANFCAISPLAPTAPGYCTFANCASGECPSTYACCDLSSLGSGIACLNASDAATASGFGAQCD